MGSGIEQALALGTMVHSKWKSWFAWRPVKVDGAWKWMTRLYKRERWALGYMGQVWIEYGTIFDVLIDPQDGPRMMSQTQVKMPPRNP